ncbi:MAG TPA: LuxR C-terminal-related transcriptional regulator, partial [Acidobacteriota bacterium]|nr:LuxR C-terminal-related transcriptional regulator [Acidobacteriota bacterium]
MRLLDVFGRRSRRAAELHVMSGDAFAAFAEGLSLTPREGEIVRLLLEGKDSKQITAELFISDHTVKNHIHHVYRKLGIKNRIQLVRCFQPVLEDPGRPAAAGDADAGEPASFRRAALPAAVLLLVLALMALVAWRPWGLRPRPAAFPPNPALAVLDFENLSADAELDKWVTGLPLLLATDLGQSKRIRTVSDDAVYGALKKFDLTERRRYSREELRRLARELKADYLISGSLMMAGGRIVVTVFLQDARTGTPIRTEKLDCQDEKDLMLKSDGLARLLRSGLNRTAAQAQDDIDLDIEVLTTSSALAYKYYAEGWRYHRTGDYEQSLIMLGKAVELDPEFAMAFRMMASDSRNLRYIDREAEYLRKAFELSAGLPEDCRERHLIRADYYGGSEATWELAIAEFKKVLENHPYDLVANNNLAVLCYETEDFESAVRYADVPVRQGTSDPFPHHTKAASLRALGRTREALEGLRAYHEDYPANRLIYQTLIATLLDSGDLAGAAAAIDKAVSIFPDPSWSNWRGVALFNTRGAAAAREEFRMLFLMDEPGWRLRARLRLIMLALAEGRYSEAEKECLEGAELAESIGESTWSQDFRGMLGQVLFEQGKTEAALAAVRPTVATAGNDDARRRSRLYVLGQVYARTGDLAALEELTDRLRVLAAPGSPRPLVREFDLFTGVVEFERGRYREATAALEKAAASLPTGRPPASFEPLIFCYLGLAREKAGDPAGAGAAFDKILEATNDRLYFGDVYPLAVFGKARAEEALGRKAAAREGYRSFLALWSQADPG